MAHLLLSWYYNARFGNPKVSAKNLLRKLIQTRLYLNFGFSTSQEKDDSSTNQDERHISVVMPVEVLDLLDRQVQEGEVVAHDNR